MVGARGSQAHVGREQQRAVGPGYRVVDAECLAPFPDFNLAESRVFPPGPVFQRDRLTLTDRVAATADRSC